MNVIQPIAIGLLFIYSLGALYYLIAVSTYAIRRQRNPEISLLVDVLSRLVVIFSVTFFWPVRLVLK